LQEGSTIKLGDVETETRFKRAARLREAGKQSKNSSSRLTISLRETATHHHFDDEDGS